MCDTDPIETTDRYKKIERQLNQDIAGALEKDGLPTNALQRGLCNLFWIYKKQILNEKYGIQWRSPSEITPHVVFD